LRQQQESQELLLAMCRVSADFTECFFNQKKMNWFLAIAAATLGATAACLALLRQQQGWHALQGMTLGGAMLLAMHQERLWTSRHF
jgi:hypothetical protein